MTDVIPTVSEEATGIEAAETAPVETIYVVRAAAAVLRLPEDAESMFMTPEARETAREIRVKIAGALEADARVASVVPMRSGGALNATTTRYVDVNPAADDILDVLVDYYGLRLNEPLEFVVHVPSKNQPLYRGAEDLPSDDYLVHWDGDTILVQWSQEGTIRSSSGGHVALDILNQATEAAGYTLEIIACAPSCLHKFIHSDFVTFNEPPTDEGFDVRQPARGGSSVAAPWPLPEDPWVNIHRMSYALGSIVAQYGEAKSQAIAVLDMENRARADVQTVLSIAHKRVLKRRPPRVLGWIADSWQLRGTRRFARQLSSELWVALIELDSRRRTWAEVERQLRSLSDGMGLSDVDALRDVNQASVSSIDVGLLRDSIQELSARREGRVLALVTLVGAVGALVGAVVGSLLA